MLKSGIFKIKRIILIIFGSYLIKNLKFSKHQSTDIINKQSIIKYSSLIN